MTLPRSKRRMIMPSTPKSSPPLPTVPQQQITAPVMDPIARRVIDFLDKEAAFETMTYFKFYRLIASFMFGMLIYGFVHSKKPPENYDELIDYFNERQIRDLLQVLFGVGMVIYTFLNSWLRVPTMPAKTETQKFIELYENPSRLHEETNALNEKTTFHSKASTFIFIGFTLVQLFFSLSTVLKKLKEPRLNLFNFYGFGVLCLIPPVIFVLLSGKIESSVRNRQNAKLFEQYHIILKKTLSLLINPLQQYGYELSLHEYSMSNK